MKKGGENKCANNIIFNKIENLYSLLGVVVYIDAFSHILNYENAIYFKTCFLKLFCKTS